MITVKDNPDITDWNLDTGYDETHNNRIPYPRHALGLSEHDGIQLNIDFFVKDYFKCRGSVEGYKIILNTPGEVPEPSKHYFWAPFNENIVVYIKPKMITTSSDLRSYETNQRQCFFSSERKLRFFKMYTQRNCELECLANFTKSKCGCVKFGMPSKINSILIYQI